MAYHVFDSMGNYYGTIRKEPKLYEVIEVQSEGNHTNVNLQVIRFLETKDKNNPIAVIGARVH
jgi:hypothetical protein